jgi:hypothetical protein
MACGIPKLEIQMAIDFDFLRHRLGLTSTGGNTSLALQQQRFDRAEAELEAARAAMRSAADAAGIERSGLFAGSTFIKRSTGDGAARCCSARSPFFVQRVA